MTERIASYEAFWPYYVAEHRNPTCRHLHFVGTSLVWVCLVLGLVRAPVWLIGCPLAGYAFAWLGHFVFAKNRPATFTYPLWSLRADFRMYFYTWLGRMPAELARAAQIYPAAS
jgi:hypothetical protein